MRIDHEKWRINSADEWIDPPFFFNHQIIVTNKICFKSTCILKELVFLFFKIILFCRVLYRHYCFKEHQWYRQHRMIPLSGSYAHHQGWFSPLVASPLSCTCSSNANLSFSITLFIVSRWFALIRTQLSATSIYLEIPGSYLTLQIHINNFADGL